MRIKVEELQVGDYVHNYGITGQVMGRICGTDGKPFVRFGTGLFEMWELKSWVGQDGCIAVIDGPSTKLNAAR